MRSTPGPSGSVGTSSALPVETAFAFDLQDEIDKNFAEEMGEALGISVTPFDDLASAVGASDVCVPCAPSKESFHHQDWSPRGICPIVAIAGRK